MGPVGPEAPSDADAFKAWVLQTAQRLEELEKSRDRDHAILSKIDEGLEKLGAYRTQEQGAPPLSGKKDESILDLIREAKSAAKDLGLVEGGNENMNELYTAAGKKLFDGVIDTAVRRITKDLGGEAAHVTLRE